MADMKQAPPGAEGSPEEESQEMPEQESAEGGGGEASAAIQSIQDGFKKLSEMMQGAQGAVSPEDMQLFQSAVQATDAFVQSISGPAQEAPAPQGPPPAGGPMAAHANANAKPVSY
jgi:hypothetical protein